MSFAMICHHGGRNFRECKMPGCFCCCGVSTVCTFHVGHKKEDDVRDQRYYIMDDAFAIRGSKNGYGSLDDLKLDLKRLYSSGIFPSGLKLEILKKISVARWEVPAQAGTLHIDIAGL